MIPAHPKPPLRALQVFEAAARLVSFTGAGQELGITQSAVSRQIADLEATLGVDLFVRNGARLTVTPTGQRLAVSLTDAFARTWSAVAEARRSDQVVTLSMLPSVAARWFAPRLGAILHAHPDMDLRISASRHLVDFAAEGVDAAIRYSRAPDPSVDACKLADETVFPVCAPAYAKAHNLAAPQDLYRVTLLRGDIPEDWPSWLKAAGLTAPPPPGPRLGDDAAILQAAVEQQGVALGRSLLVADDIAAGRLVAPFDVSLPASHSYWFVEPEASPRPPALAALKAWLQIEMSGAREAKL